MTYKEKLKSKMDEYVHFVYKVTRSFPREEMYGCVSQWRRSTLSIVLNYIEGFARHKKLSQLHFLEISYGSFTESKYLLNFSYEELFITQEDYEKAKELVEEIGAMLWTEMTSLRKSIKNGQRRY